MIHKISAEDRFLAQHGWLSSYHLFSFAEYYDPLNMNFGVLRVFNDDYIDGGYGFDTHGHKNMEIVTIVLEGSLTHQDTLGNTSIIQSGDVQYMSAGTGVLHSEINTGDERTHLYQIWLAPYKDNLEPSYEQKNFLQTERKNTLVKIISNTQEQDTITISADASIYVGYFEKNNKVTYAILKNRGVFVYITIGAVTVNGTIYQQGDQMRINNEDSITLEVNEEATFVLIDVKL